jgi:hypothetical protein
MKFVGVSQNENKIKMKMFFHYMFRPYLAIFRCLKCTHRKKLLYFVVFLFLAPMLCSALCPCLSATYAPFKSIFCVAYSNGCVADKQGQSLEYNRGTRKGKTTKYSSFLRWVQLNTWRWPIMAETCSEKTFSFLFYSHFNWLRQTSLHERLCFKGNTKQRVTGC